MIRLHGQVVRIEPSLGFGFIVDDAGMDWFFVREGVRGSHLDKLACGERVMFDFESTPKGPRAIDVVPEFPQEVE